MFLLFFLYQYYHLRMKGISNDSITYKSKKEIRSLYDIYKQLHDGKIETFDLCCDGNKMKFICNKNYTISTRPKFIRVLNKNTKF